MISATTNYSKPSVAIPASSNVSQQPMYLTLKESLLEINNDGVSLLRAGDYKAAMIRLARCLTIMRTKSFEGDKEVHYRFTRTIRRNTMSETSNDSQRYTFTSPLEIVGPVPLGSLRCLPSDDEDLLSCKLLSLVLFNLSLAHHLYSQELIQKSQYKFDEIQRKEVSDFLRKSLSLYELCHSSLVFTNSGSVCSDLSIAVVVTNNVGEIHKELHQQLLQESHQHRYSKAAIACSEQLIQIFMFFAANGQSKRLEGLGDILSNAMATLNGTQTIAPAA